MGLHLEFEPHSWYMGFAIKKINNGRVTLAKCGGVTRPKWEAYTDNGNTYYIDSLSADTLRELKESIRKYHSWNAERDKLNRRKLGENV